MKHEIPFFRPLWFALFLAVGWPGSASAERPTAEHTADGATESTPVAAKDKTKKPPRVSFKPGRGFELESGDKRFSLRIRARLQLLYTLDVHRTSSSPDEVLHGFQVRRARLTFSGHVFGKHNEYKIALALSPTDVGLEQDGTTSKAPLLAATLGLSHLRDLSFQIGQFAVGYNRQRGVSSKRLQFVERSTISRALDFGYDLGLEIYSDDLAGIDLLRYQAGIFFGEGRSAIGLTDFGMLYAVRLEAFPLGIFKTHSGEGDPRREREPRLALGVGYAFENLDPSKVEGEPAADSHHATGDVQLLMAGWSLEASVMWQTAQANLGSVRALGRTVLLDAQGRPLGLGQHSELGWYAQTGLVLPWAPVEMAVRFGDLRPLVGEEQSPRHELGGVLNWYIHDHNYKLQLDYFREWRDEPIVAGDDQVRLQVQVTL